MAGNLLDGPIVRTVRPRFSLATQGDDAAIRRLLRENPMRGNVSLTFEREPDYFRGANIAGAEDETVLARDEENLVCVGRCSTRARWVNGHQARVGYLAELRLDESARGKSGIIREGYQFFRELQRENPADFYFTSIASDNERALRFLERGVKGMPRYTFLTDFVTLLIPVPRHPRPGALQFEMGDRANAGEIVRLLNSHGKQRSLAAAWTEEDIVSLAQWGLPLERFHCVRDGNGMIACGALWDQRSFRQIVVRDYARGISTVRPLVNFINGMRGAPRLPARGSTLAHAFLSPLAIAEGHESLLPDFVAGFFPAAALAGIEYLTLGMPAGDAMLAALQRRFSTRSYHSRLYRVSWDETSPLPGARHFHPEVALL